MGDKMFPNHGKQETQQGSETSAGRHAFSYSQLTIHVRHLLPTSNIDIVAY